MARAAAGEFESATENAALVELIRARITAEGPITFHDFMELALYHPQLGYYASREPMGRERDYLTSPEVHPIFGALVGKQIAQFWELMGRPATFDLVEQGAGTGLLARDILFWAQHHAPPDFFAATRYRIVEVSASLRRRQEQTLAALGPTPPLAPPRGGEGDAHAASASGAAMPVEWFDALPDAVNGCLLSNELIDSFPVHRVANRDGKLREVYVTTRDGEFVEELRPLSDQRIAEYFEALGDEARPRRSAIRQGGRARLNVELPGDGCVAEVNLRAVDWMREVAQKLQRGFVLTFDYGYEARELYAPWRRDGTLMCFYRHNPSADPYARVGKQDMTSHVDFTTLMREGEERDLEVAGFTTQCRFLSALGIGAGVAAVAKETPQALEEYYARRRAVQELIDPAGLGRIRVLAQRKGVPPATLAGFANGDA